MIYNDSYLQIDIEEKSFIIIFTYQQIWLLISVITNEIYNSVVSRAISVQILRKVIYNDSYLSIDIEENRFIIIDAYQQILVYKNEENPTVVNIVESPFLTRATYQIIQGCTEIVIQQIIGCILKTVALHGITICILTKCLSM